MYEFSRFSHLLVVPLFQMQEMIDNLEAVFEQMIKENTWMGEQTKEEAYSKVCALFLLSLSRFIRTACSVTYLFCDVLFYELLVK